MENKQTFGAFICQRRKEMGMTQKEFAQKLYVTDSAVSKWERGLAYPDITLLQDTVSWYAVDDLIVDRDARCGGIPFVAKERRLCAAFFNVASYKGIKLLGAYSLADVLTSDEQSLARDASCLYHSGNLIGIFQLNHAYASNFESAFITAAVVSSTFSRPSTHTSMPFAA